jgi:3,4-dihydroxy-9,10-secoandrosta-1,3,5(10)-triene-9,17-dione 4,5-dioxygenase
MEEKMRVKALGYVIIGSADIAAWRRFATNVLGLMVSDRQDGGLYLKMDERHSRYLIVPHSCEVFLGTGWEMNGEAEYETAVGELLEAGIGVDRGGIDDCRARRVNGFAAFTDPSGNRGELFWGPITDFARMVSPIGVSGFITGDMGMGHVVLPAPNYDATLEFWTNTMGFGRSDFVNFDMGPGQSPIRISFLHCDNARQHSLAIAEQANEIGCDHLLIEVADVDEVGRCLYRCEDEGVPLRVTLGRHINDNMLSFYMHSPGGFSIEYGAGGMRVDDRASALVYEATRGSHWGHRFVPSESTSA